MKIRLKKPGKEISRRKRCVFVAVSAFVFLISPARDLNSSVIAHTETTANWKGLPEGAVELIGERQATQKVFLRPDGVKQYIISSGLLHYKNGEAWEEIDTTVRPSSAQNADFEMTKSIYRAWFKKDFSSDSIVRLEKESNTVEFTPGELFWLDGNNLAQPISIPLNAQAEIQDHDVVYSGAYGPDTEFVYRVSDTKLSKQLRLKDWRSLMPDKAVLSDNTKLGLSVFFSIPEGVNITLNGAKWNDQPQDISDRRIEFRKDGKLLWYFAPPRAWDSTEENISANGWMEKKNDKVKLTLTVPLSWLKQTVGTVVIDPDTYYSATTDGYIQGTSAAAATAYSTSTSFNTTAAVSIVGLSKPVNYVFTRAFLEFDTSAIGNSNFVGQANLYLTVNLDQSTTDFTVGIYQTSWTSPIDATNREANYDASAAAALDANWRSTVGISAATPYASENLSTSYINKTGITQYSLKSDRDLSSTVATGNESIRIESQESLTQAYRPYLSITSGPATTVNSTADTNTLGTLRFALNNVTSGQTISFDATTFPSGSPATISVTSALPSLTAGSVTIDASSRGVILDGTNAGAGVDGLTIASSSNTINNLQIKSFTDDGIQVTSGTGNVIQNCSIYSNTDDGIEFASATTGGTGIIKGCYIGTKSDYSDLGNGDDGIYVDIADATTTLLTIGGTTGADANYICFQNDAASGDSGIAVNNGSPKILGNYIGTNASGSSLGNDNGITLLAGADTVAIGGTAAGSSNVISRNATDGIQTASTNISIVIYGNFIGTDTAGTASWPNGDDGIQTTAGKITIGNVSESQSNVIGPNTGYGINASGFIGSTVTFGGIVDINDDVTFARTVDLGSSNVKVFGNWTTGASVIMNAGSSTVTFDGSSSQTITTNGNLFYNVILNNTGAGGSDLITLVGKFDVDGSLTLTDGVLTLTDASNPNVTITQNLTINNSADPGITRGSGTWTFDGGVGSATLTDNKGINLGAIVLDQTAGVENLLSLGSSATMTSLSIDGTVGQVDHLSLGNSGYSLTLTGNGTPLTINGTLDGGTNSTVIFAPAATTGVNVPAGTFRHIQFNKASNVFMLQGDLVTNGNLTVTAGTLDVDSNGNTVGGTVYNITVGGSWANSGTFLPRTGTVTFNGSVTPVTLNNGASAFKNLTINKASSSDTVTLSTNNLTVDGTFNITTGTLDLSGTALNITAKSTTTIGANGRFLKGTGTFAFVAFSTTVFTDSSSNGPQNLGIVTIS